MNPQTRSPATLAAPWMDTSFLLLRSLFLPLTSSASRYVAKVRTAHVHPDRILPSRSRLQPINGPTHAVWELHPDRTVEPLVRLSKEHTFSVFPLHGEPPVTRLSRTMGCSECPKVAEECPQERRRKPSGEGDRAMAGDQRPGGQSISVEVGPGTSILDPLEPTRRLASLAQSLVKRPVLGTATKLADMLRGHQFDSTRSIATQLAEFLRELTDADVAFLRIPVGGEFLELASDPVWAGGSHGAVGTPPVQKYVEDGPCRLEEISGGDRWPEQNRTAESRGIYRPEELKFIHWVQSEAWMPLRVNGAIQAVVSLGKGVRGHFGPERLGLLREYEAFVEAFYHLAELAEDKVHKALLLRDVAARVAGVNHGQDCRGILAGGMHSANVRVRLPLRPCSALLDAQSQLACRVRDGPRRHGRQLGHPARSYEWAVQRTAGLHP